MVRNRRPIQSKYLKSYEKNNLKEDNIVKAKSIAPRINDIKQNHLSGTSKRRSYVVGRVNISRKEKSSVVEDIVEI